MESVMKVVVALMVLSSLIAVPAAIARDAKKRLRDNRAFCREFVIHDPDSPHNCCALSQSIRDCPIYDWSGIDRF